jgi:mannose-6-phosphate isomerase
MTGIRRLFNPVQEYAWGSTTAIPELLGQSVPADRPQAELWMGAHPRGPSLVEIDGRRVSLAELIAREPEAVLGAEAVARFGPELPFLFKVLAAARPLSIQAHPDREQARAGFDRENQERIPLDAFRRSYRDANHKPEILCALTPFWALKGFRPAAEIFALGEELGLDSLRDELALLQAPTGDGGLKAFFGALMRLPARRRELACAQAAAPGDIGAGRHLSSQRQAMLNWIGRLQRFYPGDIGSLAPLFLNLVRLEPGEAIFLPAGELHAYLEGTGVELMANSDNVLRGGLTPKHVDVPELLRILRFVPASTTRQEIRPAGPGETVFVSPAREFRLSRLTLSGRSGDIKGRPRSVEILLCTRGEALIRENGSGREMLVRRGGSLLVPAGLPGYAMRGEADLYKASVPAGKTAPGGGSTVKY